MTSYPKTVWKFIPWSKAMVAGATVQAPEYKAGKLGSKTTSSRRRRRKRRRRKKNAKKD